jgi:hypothetical protein
MKIMKLYLLGIILVLVGCGQSNNSTVLNQDLIIELDRMVKVDQTAAWIPEGKFEQYSLEEWKSYKDSVFTANGILLQGMFKEHGYLDFDLVGKEGSNNFWLMVQHCDHLIEFQKEVLSEMKIAVLTQKSDSENYGFLVDRVKLNSGEKQIYGTQCGYRKGTCQAFPKDLSDSLLVNKFYWYGANCRLLEQNVKISF